MSKFESSGSSVVLDVLAFDAIGSILPMCSLITALTIASICSWVKLGLTMILIFWPSGGISGWVFKYSDTASTTNSLFLLPSFSRTSPAWIFSAESTPHWSENRNTAFCNLNAALPKNQAGKQKSAIHGYLRKMALSHTDKLCVFWQLWYFIGEL